MRPATVALLVPALLACDALGGTTGNGASVDDRPMLPAQVARPPAHVLVPSPDRPQTTGLDSSRLAGAYAAADSLPRLRCLLVARHGEIQAERCRNALPGRAANVKSVSKSVLSALVGVAIEEGHLDGAEQRIVPLFQDYLDGTVGDGKERITIGHLLSMQSGLERTSGRNYGRWVASRNWVRDAVRRPMVEEPGGRMLYSTGNYHLLSAILTDRTGMSTLEFARSRLGEPLGIRIPAWQTDPQGIYLGGNNMLLSPRAMVRFGELYRNGGMWEGRQVVPGDWVRASLEPRTRSRWSGEAYGYGWFLGDAGGYRMFFAWGYGGQFIFVVPDLELTMVTTSDPNATRGGRHLRTIHRILDDWIVPGAVEGSASPPREAATGRAAPAPVG